MDAECASVEAVLGIHAAGSKLKLKHLRPVLSSINQFQLFDGKTQRDLFQCGVMI
jgi:hypothetical protein